jgi:hypothetical protein
LRRERYAQHAAGPAQQGFYSGDQFGHCEGFGQIIVSPRIKAGDPVLDRVARGQDQDRERLSDAPRRGEDGKAVTIGQAEIENRGIVIDELDRSIGVCRRAGNVDSEPDIAELRLQNAR